MAGLGPSGLLARRSEVARLLRNEGATYNVTRDNQSRRQPWSLDPCPLVLEEAEWSSLESAVAQRVALLDLVFADIYGERRLVAEGHIPAELVLGHPAFLRACVGMRRPGRPGGCSSPPSTWSGTRTGEFRAIGDRAQAPSGLGYALVNRTILSRVLPNLHRESGVERLAGFFRSIRAGVAAAAPEGVDEPRVVILTPGPLSETYFEHAYLASYLGYALVEGRDLVVNNNRVWLRSLAGFDPVDVVIRRVDDQWCDPVELRADSLLGVPGLLEVARRGRVTVVNPLGTGVIEDPALTGLLGTLAPVLLGEELALRGPETWWCGDEPGLSHVLAHLEQPDPPAGAARRRPSRRWWPRTLSADGARRPARPDPGPARRLGGPGDHRALHRPDGDRHRSPRAPARPSSAPSPWPTSRRAPGPSHGYRVLPGGLTRVGAGPDSLIISSRSDGTSKDTWVASAAAGPPAEHLAALGPDHGATPGGGRHRPPCFPGGWPPSCSFSAAPPSTPSWSSGSSGPCWPASTSPSAWAWTAGAESLQVLLIGPRHGLGLRPGVRARRGGRRPAAGRRSGPDRPAGPRTGAGADRRRRCRAGRTGPPDAEPDVPTDRRALALLLDAGVDGSLVSSLGLLVDAAYSVREQLSSDTWQLVGDVEEELARLRNRPPTQLVGRAVQPAAPAPGPAGPGRAVGREHGAGLGLAVPRCRTPARAGPVAGAAAARRCWCASGPGWSRTSCSSRCSRRRRA